MMKPTGMLILWGWCLVFGCLNVKVAGAEKWLSFSQLAPGEVPSGFRSAVSGEGGSGQWKILPADFAPTIPAHSPQSPAANQRPVLAQIARESTDEHFPLLVYEGESFNDFTLTTRFKLVDGVKEQMAGIAFRLRDEKNYYVIRASSLGRSLMFYKFVNGKRSQPVGNYLDIARGVWHDLKVECRGNSIRCLMDNKEVIPPIIDSTFTGGKIGFWTKSDSVSYFADTHIEYTPYDYLAKVLVRDFSKRYAKLLELKIFAPSTTNAHVIQVVASSRPGEVGQIAGQVEQDVIKRNTMYSGKVKKQRIVTLPLHDVNGEVVAAVRLVTKAIIGQTEAGAVARALPIVKEMEQMVRSGTELMQ